MRIRNNAGNCETYFHSLRMPGPAVIPFVSDLASGFEYFIWSLDNQCALARLRNSHVCARINNLT